MIELWYGVPGSGKTTAMIGFVGAHADEQRFFVVDRVGEWDVADPDEPGALNPRWRGVHAPFFRLERSRGAVQQFYWEWEANEWQAVESPRGPWPRGVYLFQHPWEGLEVAALARDVGNVVYVDDEIDTVATVRGWQENPVRDMVHRGRHMPNAQGVVGQLHILGACRRPQSLHVDMTAMCDQAMIFRCQGHRTLGRLLDDSMITEDEWNRIRTLPNLRYKLWKATGEEGWGEVSNPFPTSAPAPSAVPES